MITIDDLKKTISDDITTILQVKPRTTIRYCISLNETFELHAINPSSRFNGKKVLTAAVYAILRPILNMRDDKPCWNINYSFMLRDELAEFDEPDINYLQYGTSQLEDLHTIFEGFTISHIDRSIKTHMSKG